MPLQVGGGKYDKQIQALAKETGAAVNIIVVADGDMGKCGFSCAMTPEGVQNLPAIIEVLKQVAKQFEDLITQQTSAPAVDDDGKGSFSE